MVSPHKLITITGGKWTSYRRMAEDTVDKAIRLGLLEDRKCRTRNLHVHGYRPHPDLTNHLYVYGNDEPAIKTLANTHPEYAKKLHADYAYTVAEVIWAVRHEMARDVEDVLARRVRLLYIDARAAIAAAPIVAEVIAQELNKGQDWIDKQVEDFTAMAKNYLMHNL
jgi:glycerol-3-phosphate dehydrogenase